MVEGQFYFIFFFFTFLSAAPLGSVKELAAKSCAEIRASEGIGMADGKHWIYSDENADRVIQVICKGNYLGCS